MDTQELMKMGSVDIAALLLMEGVPFLHMASTNTNLVLAKSILSFAEQVRLYLWENYFFFYFVCDTTHGLRLYSHTVVAEEPLIISILPAKNYEVTLLWCGRELYKRIVDTRTDGNELFMSLAGVLYLIFHTTMLQGDDYDKK